MLQPSQVELLDALATHVASRNITQQAIALATGVHQSQISRILSGEVRRASKNVIKICKYAEALPRPQLSAENKREAAISELMSLIGRSSGEDAAFRQVVVSLRDWRQTWVGDR